jgi:hypothetical protein
MDRDTHPRMSRAARFQGPLLAPRQGAVLTARDVALLQLLTAGCRNRKEMARRMGITYECVRQSNARLCRYQEAGLLAADIEGLW